jgi:HK97 family phage portal protein
MGFIRNLATKALVNFIAPVAHSFKWGSMSLFGSYAAQRNITAFIEEGYGKNPYVYAVVKKISDLSSRCPYKFVDANGKETQDFLFIPCATLFENPNLNQTGQEFRAQTVTQIEITGNAYWYYDLVNGKPINLEVYDTKNMRQIFNRNGDVISYEYTRCGYVTKIPLENIWHIKFDNPTGRDEIKNIGFSPLQPAMQVVEASNDIFEAEGHIFKNRGVSTIITNDSDRVMLPKEVEELDKQFNEDIGGAAKYGKIKTSTAKLRVLEIGNTPAQLQLSQNSVAKLRVICSCYGISPMIFGDTERSTYNNMQEATKAMYLDVIFSITELVYNEFNDFCRFYFKTKTRVVIDKDKVEAVNTINTELSKKVIEEVKAGILTAEQGYEILYPKKN